MQIRTYKTAAGKDVILDFIDSLEIKEREDGLRVLDELNKNGLTRLITKHFEGKIWEIKFYKYNRIFYVMVDKNNINLLHACKKQKNKAELTDKRIAKQRAKEIHE